ncbi:hypothetical protein PHO31112_04741 [Pandoraea horticolens]|uniref:Uncharacterized protein n=1 Tax=Pandoraea horticolens TaxID=2508298 RepID=A0A5E4YV34_9BURK|nr:hypothetical protein [Pandoraea horticolens]VVE51793.1 hypothetical protein PHO31112_04741 [Pandoraea horticolens]
MRLITPTRMAISLAYESMWRSARFTCPKRVIVDTTVMQKAIAHPPIRGCWSVLRTPGEGFSSARWRRKAARSWKD